MCIVIDKAIDERSAMKIYSSGTSIYFYVSCVLSIIHDITGVRTGTTEGLCAETAKVFGPIDCPVGRGDVKI